MSGGTFGFEGFKNRALELPAGVTSALAVDISPGGRARLRYNDVAKQLEQSIDGGAYTPLGGTFHREHFDAEVNFNRFADALIALREDQAAAG